MIHEPVLSEFWRPPGKFSFGVPGEVVEVKNLYDDPGRHCFFANLRYSPLHRNEYLVFHFFLHLAYVTSKSLHSSDESNGGYAAVDAKT